MQVCQETQITKLGKQAINNASCPNEWSKQIQKFPAGAEETPTVQLLFP
jgi:hypothetical protein